jgi:hypothetical protein
MQGEHRGEGEGGKVGEVRDERSNMYMNIFFKGCLQHPDCSGNTSSSSPSTNSSSKGV